MSRRRQLPQGAAPAAEDPKDGPDLETELVSARYDLQLLRGAFVVAWEEGLGYGPKALDYSRPRSKGEDPAFRNVPLRYSPEVTDDEGRVTDVGGDMWVSGLAHRVGLALDHLAWAQHRYGDLPDGQTVWPVEPFEGRQVLLSEALLGVRVLDACCHQLQVHRGSFGGQEASVALEVAEGCRSALGAMPTRLWRRELKPRRKCLDCGRDVQDSARRCYACRQRLSRSVKAAIDRRSA